MRKARVKHKLQQLIVETEVADAVHGDELHLVIRETLNQLAAKLLEGGLVVSKVIVFKVDDTAALLIAQLDFLQDVIERTAPIIRAERRMHRAEGAFVRATPRSDH